MKAVAYILILCFFFPKSGLSQAWMSGYSYRKKIVVDKSRVIALSVNSGTGQVKQDLSNFPLLIDIQDRDLIQVPGSCSNKLSNPEGRDIAFTLATGSQPALNFQLEHYDPATGKLTCWVKIPALSANGTASVPTSIYFYYGSALLHDPLSQGAVNVWSGDFNRIWHLQQAGGSTSSADAQSGNPAQAAYGNVPISEANFVNGKIGPGISLNGNNQSFHSSRDTSTSVTVSAWVNLNSSGAEQVILANDSINTTFRNGYVLKVNAQGYPALDIYKSKTLTTMTGSVLLELNKWYYLIASVDNSQATLFLNGIKIKSQNSIKMGNGGQLRLGTNAQGSTSFNGKLDEVRVMKATKLQEFLQTEYNNQDNPAQFYTVYEEEYNPSEFSRYSGPVNGLWTTASNWSSGIVPAQGSNVIIPPGKSVRLNGNLAVALGKLILNSNALLSLERDLEVRCLAQLDQNSDLKLGNGVKLTVRGQMLNDGRINLNQAAGTLSFAGADMVQTYSGNGSAQVYALENGQLYPSNQLVLNAAIWVAGYVSARKGLLNANGNLSLLATEESNTAAIRPVDGQQANISGTVHVQQYLNGDYPAPATARSWRLLASPVYHDDNPKRYGISAYQNAMFITGPGGIKNGFDSSPLNSGTIYTHDQSLPGTLSQKYLPISDTNAKIASGSGIYVFSRGSRTVPGAYTDQIEHPPFSNPKGYYLNHTGKLYIGDLEVLMDNKSSGAAGDGYHLAGNPYASDISWAGLTKSNLTSFIWIYDPLNKDYIVTDEPATVIKSGTAFFVKVKPGFSSGTLKFSENSKRTDTLYLNSTSGNKIMLANPGKLAAVGTRQVTADQPEELTLSAVLSRGPFSQKYKVVFDPQGADGVDENDAPKIAEGFVNLASRTDNTRLSIERRGLLNKKEKLPLYVSGWESGEYNLSITCAEALLKHAKVILTDQYLRQEIPLKNLLEDYVFTIDPAITASQGENRFSFSFTPLEEKSKGSENGNGITAYPNPVFDKLYLKSDTSRLDNLNIFLMDIMGNKIEIRRFQEANGTHSLDCTSLARGIYLLRISQKNTSKTLKTFKIFKQ